MKPFTVLLLYPDDFWEGETFTYLAWVMADDVVSATKVGQKEAAFAQSPRRKVAEFVPLLVLEGHHDDVNPGMPRVRPKVRHECACGHVWQAPASDQCPRCVVVA